MQMHRPRRPLCGKLDTMPVLESDTITKMTELLVEAAKPRRIILFGSHARGDAGADSDIDLMVIERAVPDRIAEMVRLRRALLPLAVAVDLLVVAEEKFNYWQDTPGNVYSEAATEGRVLYEEPQDNLARRQREMLS